MNVYLKSSLALALFLGIIFACCWRSVGTYKNLTHVYRCDDFGTRDEAQLESSNHPGDWRYDRLDGDKDGKVCENKTNAVKR